MFFIGIYEINPNGFGDKLVHVLYDGVSLEFAEKKSHMLNVQMGFECDKYGGFITERGNIHAAFDHSEDLPVLQGEKCTCGCEYTYLYGLCYECSEAQVKAA